MANNNKPTIEEFKDYRRVQLSGETNMFDIPMVCALAQTALTREKCEYIMENYSNLMKEYKIS